MEFQKYSMTMNLANSIDMRLSYLGYATVGSKWHTNLLATPFNRLYLIERGTGVLSTQQEELILEPGKAYLLPAGLPCSYHCDGSLSLLFFHFNLTPPDQFDLMRNFDRLAVIDYPAQAFSQLRDACKGCGYTDAFDVICSVNHIIREMNRKHQFHWDKIKVYSRCVEDTINEINQRLSAQLRIDELAQKRYISRSYLARQFRKEVGVTIKQYINLQLINNAQWRLCHTDSSVEKISSDLGFCNQFYFSECFKKHCRVSPLQYRNGTKY